MTEEQMKSDFRFFLIYVWRFLGLPDPTPVQLDIADFMQKGGRRIGIKAFRGIGKSWICSCFVVWLLWSDINLKILVVSASKERSDAFSIFTKRILSEVPFLSHLAPDRRQGDRESNVAFDIRGCKPAHAPSVKSVGITGQMTGSRADVVIADDVEVVNNSESAAQREKIAALVAEMGGAILTPEVEGRRGGMIFLGTPQVEDTLYEKLPDAGYLFRTWTAEVPADPDVYKGQLGKLLVDMIEAGEAAGTPVEPSRFDVDELHERKLEYGSHGYALQFMLDTAMSDMDKHPLKLSDLIVARTGVDLCPEEFVWGSGEDQEMPHLPRVGLVGDRFYRPVFIGKEWDEYEGSIIYIDPSGRGKDMTGYAVVKMLHGMLIIRKWGGFEGGYSPEVLASLCSIAKEEKVNTIVIESNFGDGMFAELLRPVLARMDVKAGVEDDHVTGQKEARIIDNLEPALASHRLVIDEACVDEVMSHRTTSLERDHVFKTAFYQLTRLTRDKGCLRHDDLIDALGGAVRWWTDRMARDIHLSVKDKEEERWAQVLQDFTDGVKTSVMLDPQREKHVLEPGTNNTHSGQIYRP